MTNSVHLAPTHELGPERARAVREMIVAAFDGDFSDEDWDHTLGGLHAWVEDDRGLAAHGSVVMRRALHGGRSFRVGYVEGVAVRGDRRRQGLGGMVMAELERVIDGAYAFGALSASEEGVGFYRARGWQPWRGRIEAAGPGGIVPLPGEEDALHLRAARGRALPAPDAAALVFDWRDGDVM
ncbi:GNAT family N-acetyltransferase [Streptomyces sp. NPDC053755]|uniref:GNAT family N-acetyltransferase n=1 Tax=Streptomyces sp. NPDC053755 TaxID=3155815 RepID=UPI0034388861